MPSQDFKKAYQLLSARCTKKEISGNEAMKYAAKFDLKLVEKNQLINQLKKINLLITKGTLMLS